MSMTTSTPAASLHSAPDDLGSELARLTTLLGVTRNELGEHLRRLDEAGEQLFGFTYNDDESISLHFRTMPTLVSLLVQSLALAEASEVVAGVRDITSARS